MTPTEAIASIRASIAAGLSPRLSDIEVLVAECGRVDADAKRYRVIRAALVDEDSAENTLFNKLAGPANTIEGFDQQCDGVIAALTTQSPRNENG